MRRDEIRIFRGDVESYIEHLRTFSEGSPQVEFDDAVPFAGVATGMLSRLPARNTQWLTVIGGASAGALSLSAIIVIMAFFTVPVLYSLVYYGQPLVIGIVAILIWRATESIAERAQRD